MSRDLTPVVFPRELTHLHRVEIKFSLSLLLDCFLSLNDLQLLSS